MKTLTKSLITLAAVIMLLVTSDLYSQTVYGEQTRGTSGNNASLKCEGITLSSSATIAKIVGSNDGFWITNGSGALVQNFASMSEALGFKLPAGTYYVYPNLKSNQDRATIEVYFK